MSYFSPRSAMPLLQHEAASTCSSGPFTWQLYHMLADAERYGFQSIISWQPHGRAFRVHDQERFERIILPFYYKSSKYKSFSRQLNLYSFVRLTRSGGPDQGAYFHRQFIKQCPHLCKYMVRQKGEKKPRFLPSQEPNFYTDATAQFLPTHDQGHRAIFSPTSSTTPGQDQETSSNPLLSARELPSSSIIASSSSTIAMSSSAFVTTFGAMQKVGKIPHSRAVSAEGSSSIVDDRSVSATDSEIPKMMPHRHMIVSMPHLVVSDEELHSPESSSSTLSVTEKDAVPTTKGRPFSYFKNWIQGHETVGDFEGRKFFFVANCDRLENCADTSSQ